MKAKDMFEKLGYELKKSDDREIWYLNKNTIPVETNITFLVQDKYFCIYKKDMCNPCINLEELQAINKQVEELGWNNERD